MDEAKRLEIKNLIIQEYDNFEKIELCRKIEHGYIFGEYSNNEHYLLSDIVSIYDEVYLEKNTGDAE
jgi:hypothetical protein